MSAEKINFVEEMKKIEQRVKEKDNPKVKEISSAVLSDGTIIEMVYDNKKNTTNLVVHKDEKIEIKKNHIVNGITYKPHNPNKDFIKNNVVLFPSQPKEFISQKELIRNVQEFIHKYLSVSPFFERIASYYVLFSWIYDDFNELPYLRGLGDYGTGKSRLLQVVGSICYSPIFASGATTVSPIFRILNDFRGTLILDEADFRFSDTTAEIIKILNSGFMKGMPVLRSEGNNKRSFDVKAYNVFGPKIISTRMLYKDTALESRMITEDMNLNLPNADVPFNIPNTFWDEALEIRNKMLMFRFQKKGKSKLRPELENREIEPRLNQISLPLMSIVDDQNLISEIQNEFKIYNEKIKSDRTLSYNYQILDAIYELMDEGYINPTIQEITNKFNTDLSASEAITPRKMGYLINKCLDLKTERTREGYVLSSKNKNKIEVLCKRYGINTVKEVNDVNDVNVLDRERKDDIVLPF